MVPAKILMLRFQNAEIKAKGDVTVCTFRLACATECTYALKIAQTSISGVLFKILTHNFKN